MLRDLAVGDSSGCGRLVPRCKLVPEITANETVADDDEHRPEASEDDEEHAIHPADGGLRAVSCRSRKAGPQASDKAAIAPPKRLAR